MIGVLVTFRYGPNFGEQVVWKVAETARARFGGCTDCLTVKSSYQSL
jgi:hypothetical protein